MCRVLCCCLQDYTQLDEQFISDVAEVTSREELQRLTERHRQDHGELESRYLEDRKRHTDTLTSVVNKQRVKVAETAWTAVGDFNIEQLICCRQI